MLFWTNILYVTIKRALFPHYRQTSNISCTLVGNKIVDHSDVVGVTCMDPRPAVRPAEGPNSFHWKKVKLEVLHCCTKFHKPHVVLEYAHF